MRKSLLPTFAFLCLGLTSLHAEEAPAQVEKLTSLNTPEAWQVEGGAGTQLHAWKNALGIDLDLQEKSTVRLLLQDPVKLPEGTTNLQFIYGAEGAKVQVFLLRVLIRDAEGKEFAYRVFSPHIRGKENYIITNHSRTMPIRLTVPGLAAPVLVPKPGGNIEPLTKGNGPSALPQPPLTFVGLELNTVRPERGPIYFADFQAYNVTPGNTSLYYVLNKDEGLGEVDGKPNLPLGVFSPGYGEQFKLIWTVRDKFDGQPFLSGSQDFHLDNKALSYGSNFNERIELPITEEGTYWVQVRRLWNKSVSTDAPERIDEWDLRLDVLKGDAAKKRKPLPATEALTGSPLRIAPDRESLVYKSGESVQIQVTPKEGQSRSLRLTATRPASGQVADTRTLPVPENGEVTLALDTLPAGAYRLRAELLDGDKVLDRTERLLGIQSPDSEVATQPDPSADWKKLVDGKSLIYVGMNKGPLRDPVERLTKVKSLLDEAQPMTEYIEYETLWSHLEPMPGIYDWSEVDAVIEHARKLGQSVLVWPTFIGGEPDWIPAHFQKKSNGAISGTKAYLFQGGRINYWHSPELKDRIIRLSEAMAKRYRNNPTVHGYYLLVEHGGDNPWSGFFPGYEKETLTDYRRYCKEKWSSLDALNTRWGTKLTAWDQITVPQPDASERQRLDWYIFRRESMTGFFKEAVRAIRKIDPYKLMMVYTGAVDVDSAPEFVELGCMTADGGAAVPPTGGSRTMGLAEMGLGRRTEEVSVGRWSGDFDTQLDATLFNLTLGGGRNAHIKMFFLPGKPFSEIRDAPYSLDRFQQFIPIWKELAATETLPRQSYMLLDRNASMLNNGSTSIGADVWADMSCFDAHIPSPAVPLRIARRGKLVITPRTESYEKDTLAELISYVKGGGNLVMFADAGRRSPDQPGEDWLLLKQLGITPPTSGRNGMEDVTPINREVFPEGTASFKFRDAWAYSPQEGITVLGTFPDDSPALTRHQVGDGRVYVVWASTALPPTQGGGHPFLRDIARVSGVETFSDADNPSLWTNLLKHRDNGNYYGTVFSASWSNHDRPPASGHTLWKVPAGQYEITELITGQKLGTMSGADLASKGVPTKLDPRAVAVYRFARQ